ncbi:MAG: ion transporter [Hyphomonas sp.]|uniref:ion transporter n=1 Tax=Hyphomonas sp. TaxID=87 RepID=UPI001839A0CF|nr:ion transporter [Hyphomonas sp.]MBA3068466.1 ion transporter [Hyphomonas sp.]MBU3919263.1 ion transporter [Alphaproteobacteria bacterium]MBU4060667.1 ion transporter [Alphaproteobacteria bacterium]MBU4164651.1 ion transporter [Alphaproteobacteria bacterium]
MPRATLDLETSTSAVEAFLERRIMRTIITSLIIVNALVLGLLTYRATLSPGLVSFLEFLDGAITWFFCAEIGLKLYVYRFQFFREGWNVFDFSVIAISLVPGASAFTVMRALRVLRVLRLLRFVPMMKRITEALLKSIPGMGAILAVIILVIYVGAVMATNMYGNTANADVHEMFGALPDSALTLFQLMTMDGWSDILDAVTDDGHPYAWIFFLIFIFVGSFAILNLFIALVVEALSNEQKAALDEQMESLEAALEDRIHDTEVSNESLEDTLGHVEEGLEEAETDRVEMMRMLRDVRGELQSIKDMLAAQKG